VKPAGQRSPLIILVMEVGTVDLLAAHRVLAFLRLKKLGVVFLLFPAVREPALVLLLTAFVVGCNDSISVPVLAHL